MDMVPDHIHGNFEWEVPPNCKCGLLKNTIEEKFFFVSNRVKSDGTNVVYCFFSNGDDMRLHNDGTPIQFCPWCGDKISVKKKSTAV